MNDRSERIVQGQSWEEVTKYNKSCAVTWAWLHGRIFACLSLPTPILSAFSFQLDHFKMIWQCCRREIHICMHARTHKISLKDSSKHLYFEFQKASLEKAINYVGCSKSQAQHSLLISWGVKSDCFPRMRKSLACQWSYLPNDAVCCMEGLSLAFSVYTC